MSCSKCDCQGERVEDEAPIHRPTWQDAEPANEAQAKAWMGCINEVFEQYPGKAINLSTMIYLAVGKIPGLRIENSHMVTLQMERFIHESPAFELRKGKNGGVYRSATPTLAIESVPGTSPGSLARRIVDHIKANHTVLELKNMMTEVEAEVTNKFQDNYTCKCGNTKCNKTEKSCWRCGEPIT